MSKIDFFYFTTEVEGQSRFAAVHVDSFQEWEALIPQPYPFNHDFWYEDQHSAWVIEKSRELAREHSAPEWVYTE